MPTPEKGEADAQNTLGLAYKNGRGVPQDYAQAAQWFQEAAEQGNAVAQRNLGMEVSRGAGLKSDRGEPLNGSKNPGQGPLRRHNFLGLVLIGRQKLASDEAKDGLAWLKKAVDANYAEAEDKLGEVYLNSAAGGARHSGGD